MNTHQIKQYLEHNAWYGEQSRIPETKQLITTLIQPDYSKYWGADISHWDGVVDLSVSKAKGCKFVVIKGIDGTIQSKYFTDNYFGAVQVGLPHSSYAWLYRNANVSCVAQADAYDALMNKYPPTVGFPVAVDFETTYYGGLLASPNFDDLRKWLVEWVRLGNPKPILYSGKYFMDQYGAIPADIKDMLAGLWIANYSTLTPPLPLGWTKYIMHQFSGQGDAQLLAPGTTGKKELDLNYSLTVWGTDTTPQDVITFPHDGMKRISGARYGWDFELFISDPSKVEFEAVFTPNLETVSSVSKRKGAALAVNGGEWDRVALKDYSVSNAVVVHPRVLPVPSLFVDDNNIVFIDHVNHYYIQQALSGLRYLIRDGVIQSYLDGTEAQYTEGHARSIHGITAQGFHMVMQSVGVYPNHGLTLKQAATIMKQYGAVTAFDSGGGGDVTCILDSESLIIPENIDAATGRHFERPLPMTFCVYAKDVNMTTTLKGKSNINGLNVKDGSLVVYQLSVGQVVYGNYSATKTDVIDILHVYAADGVTLVKAFTNPCKVSAAYLTIVPGQDPAEVVTPPPPAAHTVDVLIDGVNVFHKDLV